MGNTNVVNSILPSALRGVAFITGRRGVGKSFFCATAENPELVCFIDGEAKGESLHEQLHFGEYHSVTEKASGRGPLGLWQETEKIINGIPKDKFTVVIIDNISPFELAMQAEANRDVNKYVRDFGLNLKNVQEGRFGGLKSVVNFLVTEKITAPLHAKGVKLILVTSHIAPKWAVGGPIPNKYTIKGADRWQELSVMTLILTPGDFAPIPAAVVQKEQLGLLHYDTKTNRFNKQRRLPLRLPKCDWESIHYYLDNPADIKNPSLGETPTAFETEQFSEDLSKEQLAIMLNQMQAEKEANAAMTATFVETANSDDTRIIVDNIRNYFSSNPNADNNQIIANVSGATLPLVIRARMGK